MSRISYRNVEQEPVETPVPALEALKPHGLRYCTKNYGTHALVFLPDGSRFEFWPSTGRWRCGDDPTRKDTGRFFIEVRERLGLPPETPKAPSASPPPPSGSGVENLFDEILPEVPGEEVPWGTGVDEAQPPSVRTCVAVAVLRNGQLLKCVEVAQFNNDSAAFAYAETLRGSLA